MKVNWEKTGTNEGVLTIEVDAEQVDQALDRAFKKVVKQVNLPGFRKGKVPRPIFEKRFGVESLYQDALDILLPEAYSNAVDEAGIEPVDQPEVDIEQIEKGKSLIFKATVTVKPETKLGQYKDLEIEEKDFSVSDENIEQELQKMQEQQGQLIVVEDGELQNGDHAIIDFEGFKDGEPFEGGKGEKFDLEIGSGTFIPGFEEQLVGMKPGEEKEIEVTFPEEYHAENLAGQPVTFKVKLNEIKRLNLPEIDDEFVKDVSEFDTLEELKADIKNRLEEKAKQDEENYKREAVVEKAAENATIDLPEVMISHEIDHMLQDLEQRLQMQGMNLDLYYQFSGLNEEALREQFKEDAEKRIRTRLTLEAIAEEENVEVTDEDLDEELKKIAEMYSREVDEIRSIFEAQGGLDGIKNDIKIRKTVDLLVANSKFVA